MKSNLIISAGFAASVLLGASVASAASFTYVSPNTGLPAPSVIGSFDKTTSGSNIPASLAIAANNYLGDMAQGESTVKVLSFVHHIPKNVYSIGTALNYQGVNSVNVNMSCTPPLTINSADAEEKCDLYVTYYGDNITNEPEYFTVKVAGTASSTEKVEGTFMFSASVGAGGSNQGDAVLSIVKTGDDINQGALDIGSFDKYIGVIPVRTVTVSNASGTGDANNVFIQLDGGSSKFAISNDTCGTTIPQGNACSFDVTFSGSSSDAVDSYFSSVSVGYDTSAGTQVESSAIVGYVVDTTPATPPAGALEFVADANNPTPANITMNWSDAGGRVKRITIRNSTNQPISGIYPTFALTSYNTNAGSANDIQVDPNRTSTCGIGPYEDYQYNEQANDWLPVQIPATPITLGAGSSCVVDIFYDPVFKPEQLADNAPYTNGTLTIHSANTTLTASISAAVNVASQGKLVIVPDGYSGKYNPTTNAYMFNIEHGVNTGSRDSYFAEPIQVTVQNVGNTPVTSVVSSIVGSSNPVFVYGLSSPFYGNSVLSSEFLVSPVDFWTTCGRPATTTSWTDIATPTVEPATSVTLQPLETCQVGVVYNPVSIYNGYSPSATLQITGSNNSNATINLSTMISNVDQTTALNVNTNFIPGWSETVGSNIVGFLYVPVAVNGNEFFLPSSSTVTNKSGSSTSVKALQYLRTAYTADLGTGNLENAVCGSLADFREVNFGSSGQYANWPNANVDSIRWSGGCYVPVQVTLPNQSGAFQFDVTVTGVTSSGTALSVTSTISGNGTQLPNYGN